MHVANRVARRIFSAEALSADILRIKLKLDCDGLIDPVLV